MERPKSIAVFAVLNLVFGTLGLIGGVCGIATQGFLGTLRNNPNVHNPLLEQMDQVPFLRAWTILSLALGIVASIALIVAGVGLLRTQRWARLLSVTYGVYGLLSTLIGLVVTVVYIWPVLFKQIDQGQGPEVGGAIGGIAGGVLGSCFNIMYCSLLLFFMTRPRVIAAFDPQFAAQLATPGTSSAFPIASVAAPASPATPYAPPAASRRVPPTASQDQGDEAVATLIPYRNAPALVGYYLGVFSVTACIPFLGVIGIGMAIAAFICGINGLRRAAEHPEAHGRVHAWIGIIGGALCTILGLLVNVGVIVAIVGSSRH